MAFGGLSKNGLYFMMSSEGWGDARGAKGYYGVWGQSATAGRTAYGNRVAVGPGLTDSVSGLAKQLTGKPISVGVTFTGNELTSIFSKLQDEAAKNIRSKLNGKQVDQKTWDILLYMHHWGPAWGQNMAKNIAAGQDTLTAFMNSGAPLNGKEGKRMKNMVEALIKGTTLDKHDLGYGPWAAYMGLNVPSKVRTYCDNISSSSGLNEIDVSTKTAQDKTDLAQNKVPEPSAPAVAPQSRETPVDQTQDPETWVKKLLAGSNVDTGDALVDILMSFLAGTTAMAQLIEGKETQDAKAGLMKAVTDTATSGKLDLTAAVPGAEKCIMDFSGKGNPVITLTANGKEQTRQLTDKEMRKMSVIAQDSRLTNAEKTERMAVAASITLPVSAPSILTAKNTSQMLDQVQRTASSNFDAAMSVTTDNKEDKTLSFTFS